MRGRRTLITGGAGFIGSNLAWALCGDNSVTVVDNLSTGRIDNIIPLIRSRKIRFAQGSVTDLDFMKENLRESELVFHEAAIPSVPRSVANPIVTNEAGITGTLTTLIAARDCSVEKVIFASSSSAYGDTPTLPKIEDMPTGPLSPYALTKVVGEEYCKMFKDLYGMQTISLRYFNVYGPRQNPESEYAAVIPKFIRAAMRNTPLTIYGDGEQTRDFTYVEDVVSANILAAESKVTGVFNIASGCRTSIDDLAAKVLHLTGGRTLIRHEQPRPGDIKHSLADISKAKNELGYNPKYKLEDGLARTIQALGNSSEPCLSHSEELP